MNILLIGSGGREHALAHKIAQNKNVECIYCAPGNAGTALEDKCKNINIEDFDELINFAKGNNVDLTVVGPELPLTEGIADKFINAGLKIFGPTMDGARLEGSKLYAKEFMKKYGVKTAKYESFVELTNAINYAKDMDYPLVIKADGLAAGKGVVICNSFSEAEETLNNFMSGKAFGASGETVIIEEFLQGVEASILSFTDSKTIIPMISSKDHKRLLDNDEGPNTGGMGTICPNPHCTSDVMKQFNDDILVPTLNGLKGEGLDFCGVIFFGVMINEKGVYLLEYNVRFGDPETQSVLMLLESDIVDIMEHAVDRNLKDAHISWSDGAAATIVAVSGGYPKSYKKGMKITLGNTNSKIFISGAELSTNNEILSSGGRVLCVTSTGKNIDEALKSAYNDIKNVHFDGMFFRKDIGK